MEGCAYFQKGGGLIESYNSSKERKNEKGHKRKWAAPNTRVPREKKVQPLVT